MYSATVRTLPLRGRIAASTHGLLLLMLSVACLLWGIILITGAKSLDVELFLMFLGLYGLASTVFVLWRTALGQSLFHAPVYITIVAFIEFGLVPVKVFFDPHDLNPKFHGDYTPLIRALFYMLIGMIAFWVGAGCRTRNRPNRSHEVSVHSVPRTSTLLVALTMYAVALVAKVYLIHSRMFAYTFSRKAYYSNLSSAQVVDIASQFSLYALVVLTIERYFHPTDLTRRVLFYLVFASECFWGAISGMKAPLLVNFLLVGMISSLICGKFSKRWVIGAVAGLIIVYPFYQRYRTLVRSEGMHVSTVSKAVDTFGQAITDVLRGESNSAILKQGSQSTTSRLQLLDSVGLLLSLGPNRAKLDGDEKPWMIPFFPFIPRLLWHSKPVLDKGQRFSLILGLGKDTSTAVTYPGDLLLFYGVPGLLAGMFAFGAFTQWLSDNGAAAFDKKWLFIYASIFPLETDWELDMFSLWTGVIKALVILAVLAFVIYGRADVRHQQTPTGWSSNS
jgi:hypothetical protein